MKNETRVKKGLTRRDFSLYSCIRFTLRAGVSPCFRLYFMYLLDSNKKTQ